MNSHVRTIVSRRGQTGWPLLAAVAFAASIGSIGCRNSDGLVKRHQYPRDEQLRFNYIQAKGTHNSYHIKPQNSLPEYNYTHQPLDIQLSRGVRQIELDIHYVVGKGIMVYHVPGLDDLSTCASLADCLTTIKRWSDRYREHQAVLVFLEIKEKLSDDEVELTDKYQDIEAVILSVFPRDRIVTPDDVRGTHPTLKEAILADGWPVLGKTRGRVIFHAHNNDAFRINYLGVYPELAGALMFVDSTPADSFAAIMPMNDPIGGAAEIQQAVRNGFLVRTMAVTCCGTTEREAQAQLDAALASGAIFISTDYPDPVAGFDFYVTIPGGTPCRCNPVTAPADCISTDIENWN